VAKRRAILRALKANSSLRCKGLLDGLSMSSPDAAYAVAYPEHGVGEHPRESSVMRAATEEAPPLTRAERRRTRRERISARRGAFRWLPIKFSNDLVHGSWWFVVGSIIATLIPIVPLINEYYPFWDTGGERSLPLLEDAATFGLLIASGFFFTLGSLAFVRATEEPMLKPLFSHISVHMATDELLAAWLFLFATIPFVPFMAVYVFYNNTVLLYWGCLIVSIAFVIGTYFFVLACYPSDREERRHQIVPMLVSCLCNGDCCGLSTHLSNDWLAGTLTLPWVDLAGAGQARSLSHSHSHSLTLSRVRIHSLPPPPL